MTMFVVLVHYAFVPPFIGFYMVFGFFVLSGYLMTFIMHKKYGYSVRGVGAYALNRFLRIYPLYWACFVFALVVFFLVALCPAVKAVALFFFPTLHTLCPCLVFDVVCVLPFYPEFCSEGGGVSFPVPHIFCPCLIFAPVVLCPCYPKPCSEGGGLFVSFSPPSYSFPLPHFRALLS